MDTKQVKEFIRQPYAWPGGYPLFAITSDGESLCKDCCRKEYVNIYRATRDKLRDGWQVEAIDVNWECNDLCCAHCSEKIESAYGE